MFVGYKCFNKDLTNRYGMKYEVGKLYHVPGKVKFGNDGNGFHTCLRLEDTLRYFDAMHDMVAIGIVRCFGEYQEFEDNNNDWYDMYVYQNMIIEKIMLREEIIAYALSLHAERAKRFISLFRLSEDEIILFKDKFKNDISVLNHIAYYQEDDKDVFNRYVKKREYR